MEPNLKHPLKKMGKQSHIVAAQADKPAIYVNFYQNFVTITYSIQNHKAVISINQYLDSFSLLFRERSSEKT